MAHPFRQALWYALLFLAAAAIWPSDARRRWWLLGLIGLVLTKALTPASGSLEPLLVCAAVAVLAAVSCGRQRTVLQSCTLAIFALAVFRLACSSISAIWLLSQHGRRIDRKRRGLAVGYPVECGGHVRGRGLSGSHGSVGMPAGCWRRKGRDGGEHGLRRPRSWALQLIYLVVVAYTLELAALLPVVPEPTFDHPYVPPPWSWSNAVRQLLPWNCRWWRRCCNSGGCRRHGPLVAMAGEPANQRQNPAGRGRFAGPGMAAASAGRQSLRPGRPAARFGHIVAGYVRTCRAYASLPTKRAI